MAAIQAIAAKLTFICNPTSPVGSLIGLEEIRAVAERAQGIVVVNEAYIDFSFGESAISLVRDSQNLAVLRTFSKAWGLAGLRIGAVIAAPPILHTLRIVQDPFAFDTAAQRAVTEKLGAIDQLLDWITTIRAERERMASELARLPVVRRVYPSHTNFLCVTVWLPQDVIKCCLAADVLVTDVTDQVPDSIRISIGSRADNERIQALLATVKP